MLVNRRAANDVVRREAAWRNDVENVDHMMLVGCALDCILGLSSVFVEDKVAMMWLRKSLKDVGNFNLMISPVSAE